MTSSENSGDCFLSELFDFECSLFNMKTGVISDLSLSSDGNESNSGTVM